jgi:hypothetical protein
MYNTDGSTVIRCPNPACNADHIVEGTSQMFGRARTANGIVWMFAF